METALRENVKEELPALCQRAATGSAWCALLVAIQVEPDSLAELMRVVGVAGSGKYRQRGFDACADAWSMFQDALNQGIGG